MFNFSRKSTSGKTIPSWLKPGPVYVKSHTRRSKNDPLVTQATILHVNPQYAHIRLPSGVETTVSLRDVARHPHGGERDANSNSTATSPVHPGEQCTTLVQPIIPINKPTLPETDTSVNNTDNNVQPVNETSLEGTTHSPSQPTRRSSRVTKLPKKYEDFVLK
jgi:hypothetical protein